MAHIGLTLVTRSPRLKSPSVLQHSQHDPLQDHLTRRGHTASPNGSRDAAQQKNRNSLTWVLVALTVSFTYPVLYRVSSESRAGEWELEIVSQITKNRGACALTRAGGSPYTIKLKSACREPDLSLSGLDPVPLSKIGTHLFASRVAKEKIGTLLLASEMPVPIPR